MSQIQVILFDLDDTLIRFDDYWEASMKETFRQHECTQGIDADLLFAIFLDYNTQFERQYMKQQITLRQFRNFRLLQALRHFDRDIDEQTADLFNELHRSISRTFMKANPATIELLDQLSSTYKLGIVTNGTSKWQADKIEAMGIKRFFAEGSVFTSEAVGFEKPAPIMYERALQFFQVSADEAVFVGDSWQNDVEGPGSVGIRSIWINLRKTAVPNYTNNLIGVASNLAEIKDMLLNPFTGWIRTLKQEEPDILRQPIQPEKWSPLEIVAHIWLWDRYTLEHLVPCMQEGRTIFYPTHESINGLVKEQVDAMTSDELLDHTIITRHLLLTQLNLLSASPAAFMVGSRKYMPAAYAKKFIFDHDNHHRNQIVQFLTRNGLPN